MRGAVEINQTSRNKVKLTSCIRMEFMIKKLSTRLNLFLLLGDLKITLRLILRFKFKESKNNSAISDRSKNERDEKGKI